MNICSLSQTALLVCLLLLSFQQLQHLFPTAPTSCVLPLGSRTITGLLIYWKTALIQLQENIFSPPTSCERLVSPPVLFHLWWLQPELFVCKQRHLLATMCSSRQGTSFCFYSLVFFSCFYCINIPRPQSLNLKIVLKLIFLNRIW